MSNAIVLQEKLDAISSVFGLSQGTFNVEYTTVDDIEVLVTVSAHPLDYPVVAADAVTKLSSIRDVIYAVLKAAAPLPITLPPMTQAEFNGLQTGDIVRHAGDAAREYVVTANYGDRVTAVRTVDLTNPSEWNLVSKVQRSEP